MKFYEEAINKHGRPTNLWEFQVHTGFGSDITFKDQQFEKRYLSYDTFNSMKIFFKAVYVFIEITLTFTT